MAGALLTLALPIVGNHLSTGQDGRGLSQEGWGSFVEDLATLFPGFAIDGSNRPCCLCVDPAGQWMSQTVRGRLAKAARIARLRVGTQPRKGVPTPVVTVVKER